MEIDCEGHLDREVHTTIHTVQYIGALDWTNKHKGKCAALYALSGELVRMSTPVCASLILKISCTSVSAVCVHAVYACVQVCKCLFVRVGAREGSCAHIPAHPLKGS